MKIRILSDLHMQLNKQYPLELDNKDVYTLIAGDIGPFYEENSKWLKENVRNGAFILGNHEAYGTTEDFTLENVKEYFHKEFPLESNLTFFDYDVGVIEKNITNKILLIADVLYTDYKCSCCERDESLSEKELVQLNLFRAKPKMSGSYMNDFFFYTNNGDYNLSPELYLKHFNKTFLKITKIIENNKDKEIILMTHHCLSPLCMGEYMNKGSLKASYLSDETEWIKKHENIKLIVSGHIHNQKQFKIGSTLYVMNPRGYCNEYQDKDWTPSLFVETDNWTVEKEM